MARDPNTEDIYVVVGSTGEYADQTEWVVCWCETEEEAVRHAEKAQRRADEIMKNRVDKIRESKPIEQEKNEYDPEGISMDYTGSYYSIDCIPNYLSILSKISV